jgi:hypothetical protein
MIDLLPSRRRLLGLIVSLPIVGLTPSRAAPRTAPAAPAPSPPRAFPDHALLLAAGPEGGQTDRWARLLASPLDRALGASLRTATTGGIDGVTGANQFDARATPDGSAALLVPGAAALAWLAGDPRAQFDAAHWVPVLAGAAPGIVVSRVGVEALLSGQELRISTGSPAGAGMPALLAFDLLGVRCTPQFGPPDQAAALEAFRQRTADAVFLHGTDVPEQVSRLDGAKPLFTLGVLDESGAAVRDPVFPDVPHLAELYASLRGTAPASPLFEGWRASATAVQLEFGLVLPPLTPAARVAVWRRAANQAAIAPETQAACAARAIRPLPTPSAAAFTSSIAADATALLELRRWLNARFSWQPT